MSDVLILQSVDGHPLTEQFIRKCLDANETFIVKKIFSNDRSSVELTFVDEERSELISEFLKTCYARVLLVKRPEIDQTVASTDNSFYVDDDQLSTAPSFSSKVTCFSQRLAALNRSTRELKIEEKIQVAVGRGRVIDPNSSHRDHFGHRENLNNEEEIDEKLSNDRISSPVPSVTNTIVSSVIGRGRRLAFF